ncbi:hypothetical protein VCRLGP8_990079 [Vibrio crassostreae]|nr:hypothetical protein VCRLGP8_990079 [Vibrio crassostreae]
MAKLISNQASLSNIERQAYHRLTAQALPKMIFLNA